jgi:hypothetical protein
MNNKNQGNLRAQAAGVLLFAALMLAALLPLRLWQQLRLVEQGTGFWLGGGATIPLLYVGMGILAAVPGLAAFLQRKKTALDLTRKRRVIEGVTAALAAAALVVDAVMAFGAALRLFSGQGTGSFDGLEARGASTLKDVIVYYIRSGAMACVLESAAGLFGAVFFGQLAAADFLPRKKIYLGRALALAPFAWAVCRILRRFSRTIAYLRVSDLFLGLAMLTALMLFLLAFAQAVGGVHGANKASVLFAAGIPAAVLALVCFAPRFVVYGIQGFAAPQDAPVEWCDPALALFALVFIAGRGYLSSKGAGEDAPTEEAEEA